MPGSVHILLLCIARVGQMNKQNEHAQGWSYVRACGVGAMQGILPNLAKVAPAAGISWFVFEETKCMMGMDPHS